MKTDFYSNAIVLILMVSLSFGGGCLSRMKYDEPTPPPVVDPKEVVRLRAGDTITLSFFYNPDFRTSQTIRPDGKIFLNLIGELYVEGLTPLELKRKVEKAYSRYVDKISTSVIINASAPNQVYISGAVAANRLISFQGQLTVLQALIRAGGLSGAGRLDNILVIRNQGTAEPLVFKVNVKRTIFKRDRDFVLEHHDIVYVPTRTIRKINQFVNEYIDGIIPKHVGSSFGFGYSLGGLPAKGEADVDVDFNLP